MRGVTENKKNGHTAIMKMWA